MPKFVDVQIAAFGDSILHTMEVPDAYTEQDVLNEIMGYELEIFLDYRG